MRDEQIAQSHLDDILDRVTRNAVARHDLAEVVRSSNREPEVPAEGERKPAILGKIDKGRRAISRQILETASPLVADFGIELTELRFKRINYVEEGHKDVFAPSEGEGKVARLWS